MSPTFPGGGGFGEDRPGLAAVEHDSVPSLGVRGETLCSTWSRSLLTVVIATFRPSPSKEEEENEEAGTHQRQGDSRENGKENKKPKHHFIFSFCVCSCASTEAR